MPSVVEKQIDDFFAQYPPRRHSKGQILIFAGDEPDYVYNLISGKVKQYDVTYRGDEVILNVFKASAFFPMSLAINKTTNPYIYEAETDIEVRQAPADEAVDFIKSHPDVLFDLLARVYRGTDGLLGRMAHLMSSSAKSRLLYELLLECRRFGEVQKDGGYLISINEKDLGSRAGLSRETVSREAGKLKREGLLEIRHNNIFIKDIAALEKRLSKEI